MFVFYSYLCLFLSFLFFLDLHVVLYFVWYLGMLLIKCCTTCRESSLWCVITDFNHGKRFSFFFRLYKPSVPARSDDLWTPPVVEPGSNLRHYNSHPALQAGEPSWSCQWTTEHINVTLKEHGSGSAGRAVIPVIRRLVVQFPAPTCQSILEQGTKLKISGTAC